MWRNYLRIALTLLARNRVYAAINIGGLALGLAGCLLIFNYVRYESSYDSWLPDSGRIYQVQTKFNLPGQPARNVQMSPFIVYEKLPGGFAQVEAVTSLAPGKTVTERDGQPVFIDVGTVDANFFDVLGLPFAQGSAGTALPDTNSIVLTEREAIRHFGTADALGKQLSLGAGPGKRDYRVTGVLRNLPRNTSLKLSLLFRRDLAAIPPEQRGWGNFDQQHYVKLRRGADAAAINAGLPAWEKRNIPDAVIDGKPATMSDAVDLKLVPLAGVHLGATQDGGLAPGGDPRALATFAVVALLTLAMAVMNFVNLSTARATQRAREVALRKVLGASRGQLIVQFLGESLVMAAIAMLLALAVVELATPWISAAIGADIRIAYLGPAGMLLPAAALFLVTGLLGGLYPAFYLSRFRPAEVLRANKSSVETPGNGRFRTALVMLQFAIAIGLIASTWVIFSQTRYVETVDPGYRRDGLIQIVNAWRFAKGGEYDAAHAAMLAIPGITGTTRTSLPLASDTRPVWLVKPPGAEEYQSLSYYGVDAEYLQTAGIDLLAGRGFDDRIALDRVPAGDDQARAVRGVNVVINRAAARKLGFRTPQAAIGQTVRAMRGGPLVPSVIVGVVEDMRFRSAREAIEPAFYAVDPDATEVVLVRFAGARPGEVMAALNKVWRKFEPEIPFEARFVDDIAHELYAADRARGMLFAGFSALAVLIGCLGLYSLAAFATERRTREIGIRKVLGAKVRDIVQLLVWQFSRPVVLANLIAWPVAWWAMREWLNGFDIRIALTPTPFALAGLLALAIAIATVAGQSLRVARTNPIHALRYE
ncbi:putative ABC transport system permease protein [Sphingomonas naasensis]|uniref:FtsX-like permease family protein n=1 Tax=Sphingomonas naasensis TaxID=1344951 RepID=A0A4V3QWN0_9SPHN|nr:FtsX-like permease family protein [Sphingomonas naasensis]NIJ20749.1 putative ABC transport system permease protein [Sphingomonas naasensis]TGX43162.1 FtsX-like permease family protein [Sphingomonas naasensis]